MIWFNLKNFIPLRLFFKKSIARMFAECVGLKYEFNQRIYTPFTTG